MVEVFIMISRLGFIVLILVLPETSGMPLKKVAAFSRRIPQRGADGGEGVSNMLNIRMNKPRT
jgi:hypothetical protein